MVLRTVLVIATAVVLVAVAPPAVVASGGRAPSGAMSPGAVIFGTDEVPIPTGTPTSPLATTTPVRLAFTLAFSNASRLSAELAAVSDPASPGYRHFQSYAALEREFGPPGSEVAAVEEALRSAGASSVSLAPGGLTVDAMTTAGVASDLLGVRWMGFDAPALGSGYTAVGDPVLPAELVGKVTGIDGLAGGQFVALHGPSVERLASFPSPASGGEFIQGNGSGSADWFIGSDYAQAYGATDLLPVGTESVHGATYPSGIAIATLLASGYNATNSTTLPPWTPWVVDRYFNDTFPAGWPLPTLTGVPVNEPGVPTPPAPGGFQGQNDSTGYETENSLDLEMAGSLAPGSALYNFYVSGALLANPMTSSYAPEYLADDLGAAIAYNYSPAHLAVVSCSFGVEDVNNSQWDADLAFAALEGITVVASSGDQGNAPAAMTGRGLGPWPLWPATVAFNTSGVVSVGGVTVALSGTPTARYTGPPLVASYDPSVEGIANSTAWWDTLEGAGRFAGTEGGTSRIYLEPYWQFHSAAQWPIVNATEVEGFGALGRAGPDVAFPANSTIAYVAAFTNQTPEFAVLGGTSVAAPVLAGLLADVVAVEGALLGHPTGLGFIDPELYRIASYYQANPGSANDPFRPVLFGSNAMFSAGPGWNAVAGWGGLSAPLFLQADENSTVANYTYTGPTPGLPVRSSSGLSLTTLVAVAAAATVVVIAAGVLLASRRRRALLAQDVIPPYDLGLGPSPTVSGLPGPYATFACPYCGADRPSEPGHCPKCGAM